FSESAAEFETESHTRIFSKMNDAPIGYTCHLTQRIVKFDVQLNKLIYKQNQKNGEQRYFKAFKHFFSVCKDRVLIAENLNSVCLKKTALPGRKGNLLK